MIDPAGTITFWNLAASRVFGYTAAEACGRHLHDLVVPATMIDEHRHAFREFMQTGLGRAVGQTVEMQAVRSDRTEVPVEVSVTGVWRTIDSACLVERDEHGTPIRVIGVNREAGR